MVGIVLQIHGLITIPNRHRSKAGECADPAVQAQASEVLVFVNSCSGREAPRARALVPLCSLTSSTPLPHPNTCSGGAPCSQRSRRSIVEVDLALEQARTVFADCWYMYSMPFGVGEIAVDGGHSLDIGSR